MPWQQRHSLQAWFGVDTFLLLEPMSYSKRVLDAIQVAAFIVRQPSAAVKLSSAKSGLHLQDLPTQPFFLHQRAVP